MTAGEIRQFSKEVIFLQGAEMSDRINVLTEKVVNTFKEKLSETGNATVSSPELDYLAELVKEALTQHADALAQDLQQVMNKLKADIEKPELGL
jgi:hypothetical protein